MILINQNSGSKNVVCARVGGAKTTPIMAAHFAKQIRNSAASVSVLRAKCAIILDFVQKMFELRPKNTASEEMSLFACLRPSSLANFKHKCDFCF
jgi:hypothetical protein